MSSSAATTSIDVPQSLQRLLHDVTSFQVPDLLTSKSTSQLTEKERDLLSTLKRIDVELENFTLDCTDAGSDAEERAAWSDALERARSRVSSVKREAQTGLVRARQNVRANARNALFEDMAESKEERERRREANVADRSAEDKLMTASGDVTSALQRAVTMMSIELEKSSYSSQLLDESSMTIQQATLEYSSFTTMVSSSTKLIKSMERADFYDAIMLSLSFLFFLLCIGYIVKEKLKMAKDAARQIQSSSLSSLAAAASASSSSKAAAEMAKTAIVNTVTSVITTAYSDSAAQTIETPSVTDSSFESDQPTQTASIPIQPERLLHDEL